MTRLRPEELLGTNGEPYVLLNPNLNVYIDVDSPNNNGLEPFDLTEQLAHEIGHAYFDTRDYDNGHQNDGMNMVDMSENPIVTDPVIDRPARSDYGAYDKSGDPVDVPVRF